MRATITNLSPRSRDKTLIVTFPTDGVTSITDEATFLADTGHKFRAVRTGKRGDNVDIFRIAVNIEGHQEIKGKLIPEMHADAGVPYKYHKWVADDIVATIPDMGVANHGSTLSEVEWTKNSDLEHIEMTEQSALHQRWFLRKTLPSKGLVFEWWVDVHHDDPVIQFWGKIIWSDKTDPNESKRFGHLLLRCGEFPALDFSKNLGAQNPQKVGNNWEMLLGSNVEIRDGGGLPLSGALLAFVGPRGTPVTPEQEEDNRDFQSLLAGLFGPVNGIAHNWNGNWTANRWVPRRSDVNQMYQDAAVTWERFSNKMKVNEGWGATTSVGIQNNPGTTGDQEDFGATKGIYALATKDPKFIRLYQRSIYNDVYRGFMHYDVKDGKYLPLNIEDHPKWVTWSGRTHWHAGVSSDRLGKTELNPFGDLWWGYDDQHRSQNNLAAYLQLSDDPLALDIINHITTTDMASYRVRFPQNGGGAARAQGRMAGCLANFHYLLNDGKIKEDVKTHLKIKWESIKNNPQMNVSGPVKVIGVNGPDGRKPIFDSNGNLLPTWSVWEHGLALVGLYNAHKELPTPESEEALTTLFETQVKYGCFEAVDGWWLVADMWYDQGNDTHGPLSRSNPYVDSNRGGVCLWVLASIIAAAEFLPETSPMKAKARECAQFFTNNQDAVGDFNDEWWCVAQSVNFS